jgi:hypothetical protein
VKTIPTTMPKEIYVQVYVDKGSPADELNLIASATKDAAFDSDLGNAVAGRHVYVYQLVRAVKLMEDRKVTETVIKERSKR